MPMTMDPNAKFEVALKGDEAMDAEVRPRFHCRFLSCRQWREIAGAIDELDGAAGGAEVLDRVIEQLERCVAGWRNVTDPQTGEPMAFSADRLADVLTMAEAQELIQRTLEGRPDGTDLKNSPSPAA